MAEPEPGPWKVLFDGKTVNGLRGLQKPDFLKAGWKIEDGMLTLTKTIEQTGKSTGGDLITADTYTDFDFLFQWKQTVSGDSGVMYLVRGGLGQKPTGMEFQIIDDVHHPDGLKGGPIKRTGALYAIIPAGENKQLNDKEWNEGRLIVRGNHVEHWINGAKVLGVRSRQPCADGGGEGLQSTGGSRLRVQIQIAGGDSRSGGGSVSFPQPADSCAQSRACGSLERRLPRQRRQPAVGPTPFKSRIP